MGDKYRRNSTDDEAPHSRLFVLASKDLNEEDIKKAFKDFGSIRDVWGVKDKNTGENKGIFYIRYHKTSEAALALENMKGKILGNKGIKVMIASSREQGSVKGDNEEDNCKRLFIVISKSTTDNELYEYFKQFGEIEYASIVKDKTTKQSKGFAYVKFLKFSDAAVAFEQCNKEYKAVFAQPRKPKEILEKEQQLKQLASFSVADTHPRNDSGGFPSLNFKEDGVHKLIVIAGPSVNQDQMWKLFDIVPSMDYCQVQFDLNDDRNRTPNTFEVVYTNYDWAMYALEKFHGFEYPPGQRLIVKNKSESLGGRRESNTRFKRPAPSSGVGSSPDIMQLAETIAQASSLIERAGISPDVIQSKLGGLFPDPSGQNLCNKPLPPRKPLADPEAKTEARCFVICTPTALTQSVLKNIFSRVGNLIDIYMLNNRNCGYAKYATKESAEEAIELLHGVEVLGVRLKVFEAEERPDKRQRMETDN